MVLGLWNLLSFHLPALFVLGVKVRQLTWEGGVGGKRTGSHARTLLQQCLAMQVHVTGDWEAKQEYTRTLSVALLAWQEWYNHLPGCCFAEESCEALLSRMSSRCIGNPNITTFEDMYRLFITIPPPEAVAQPTGGGLKQSLVFTILCRVRRFLRAPLGMMFPHLTNSKGGIWRGVPPEDFSMPAPPGDSLPQSMETVLVSALATLTRRGKSNQSVAAGLQNMVPMRSSESELDVLEEVHRQIRQRLGQRPRPKAGTRRRQDVAEQRATSSAAVATGPSQTESLVENLPDSSQVQAEEPSAVAASDTGSLYNFRQGDDLLSEGYVSYGDSDSLYSVGEVVTGQEADWTTLEDVWDEDVTVDPLQKWCVSCLAACFTIPSSLS